MLLLFKIPISSNTKPLWYPVPWGSHHPHSYAKEVPHSESPFSSLLEWCQQCWELERPVSSSMPRHPAHGTSLPAMLSTDHGPVGSCSICLHNLHRCSGLLSCCLPSLLGFASSHPVAVPSFPVLPINPPVPAINYVTCSSCCPHPTKNQWAVTVMCRFWIVCMWRRVSFPSTLWPLAGFITSIQHKVLLHPP